MSKALALDSNLTLLLAVGRTARHLIGQHKRLRQFQEADFDLLLGFVVGAQRLVTSPNALTEVSNIATFGIAEPMRSRVVDSVRGLIAASHEQYVPSREAASLEEFSRLGLADCAWLALLGDQTGFLTVDFDLYLAAARRGHDAVNFNHFKARIGRT